MKQEKYLEALKYFELAKKANPNNSSIHTYLGLTHKHLGQMDKALSKFKKAEDLNPENMHNKFHRAITLMTMQKDDEAEQLLHEILALCPEEPQVHIQLGKLLKKRGKKNDALQHFNNAIDLDPKDSNAVKTLIDSLNSEHEMDEDNEI